MDFTSQNTEPELLEGAALSQHIPENLIVDFIDGTLRQKTPEE
jgi:hypothetical protein